MFKHLATDWFSLREPQLKSVPFVLRTAVHGRMIITAVNAQAKQQGIECGMTLADAKAFVSALEVRDDVPDLAARLLKRIAEWCIRFTPVAAVDLPDGILLDATGCTHLWGGDQCYLEDVIKKLTLRGYDVRGAIADTPGVAWGWARYGQLPAVIPERKHVQAMLPLPPEALRIEQDQVMLLHKLGLHQIQQFIGMPRVSLRRRFGQSFLDRLDIVTGKSFETITPVVPPEPYQERLPCMEPVATMPGVEIGLQTLLKNLCLKLLQDQKGIRTAIFKGYRVDGKVMQIEIGTNRPSHSVHHLFKLFELKVQQIEPGLGIELFILEAPKVEDHFAQQQTMWQGAGGLEDERISELIDRIAGKVGMNAIHRFLPEQHYWPERSFSNTLSLDEKPSFPWRDDKLRPMQLLAVPERIDVTAPIPDYPPMLFRYKNELHKIIKADGPERIAQEWWLQEGLHRDYYRVEDEAGNRYWLFRLGHYSEKTYQWFMHGYFP